jgi:hypothetical protein
MAPFWNSQTANVQSSDCSAIQTYGYTYPEILKYKNDTPSQLAKDVYNEVEALYQKVTVSKLFATPSVATGTIAKTDSAVSEGQPQKVRLVVQNKAVHLTSAAKPPSNPGHDDYVVTPDTYREWIVNISLDAHALGGSGIIALFLGPSEEVPKNPEDWVKSPLYVGSHAVFTTQEEDMEHCENCKDQQNEGVKIAGTVHITENLIHNRVNLTGSEPEKYLKENLRWRCSGPNGVIPNTDIPSLEIAVESAGYVPSVGVIDGRPEQGPWTRHGGVTYGRPGGSQTAAA